jgi:hypothetical protein
LDILGAKDEEGQPVQMFKRNKSKGQTWKLVYVDEAKAIKMTGTNEDFGFEVNKPFFIVSKMNMGRVMGHNGGSVYL